MFITQAKEILDAVPTAKYDEKSAFRLIRSIEEEEEQMLEPLLGYDLMQHLYVQYKALIREYGSISASSIKSQDGEDDGMLDIVYNDEAGEECTMTVSEQEKVITLLRNIQCALVYRMLSNKIFSLSTSLNMGGGANRASAGDYEPADDKHLAEVRREYFMNSKKACDNILVMLERDAKTLPPTPSPGGGVDYNSSADGVDTNADGVATNADGVASNADGADGTADGVGDSTSSNGNQLPSLEEGLGEGSQLGGPLWLALWRNSDGYYLKEDLLFPTLRSLKAFYPCYEPTRFLSLYPTIRYCQDTYIAPRVDTDLMDRLLLVSATLSDVEKKALKLLRTALAYYVRAKEGARDERNEALMTADAAMSTALAYIEKQNLTQQSLTKPSSAGKLRSICKQLSAQREGCLIDSTAETSGENNCPCPCCKEQGGVEQEYETFSMLFAPGVNRW